MNNSEMIDFVTTELRTTDVEREFNAWWKQVSEGLGSTDEEDLAADLYSDGCTVEDAIAEIKAICVK